MRVYRGRGETVAADRVVSERVTEQVAAKREPAVRVWRPPRHVAFGRRDTTEDGYDRARRAARERGFPPVEREVGGCAVAYTGRTVALARVTPVADLRGGLSDRYDAAAADLRAALAELGVETTASEPPDSFCPGAHSLQASAPDGRPRKLAGLAQRVRDEVAVVAGVLVVADHEDIADVLDPVYGALGVGFDPETVGSLARAGGESGPGVVTATVEDALVGDEPRHVEQVP